MVMGFQRLVVMVIETPIFSLLVGLGLILAPGSPGMPGLLVRRLLYAPGRTRGVAPALPPVRVVIPSSYKDYLFGLEVGERDLVLELVDDAITVEVDEHDLPIGTVKVVVDVEIATIVKVNAIEVVAVEVIIVIYADQVYAIEVVAVVTVAVVAVTPLAVVAVRGGRVVAAAVALLATIVVLGQ